MGITNSVSSKRILCRLLFYILLWLNKNKIAQGIVSILSQLTFFSRKILILSTNYCQIHYLRVRISGNRHLTCSIQKKFKILCFWRPFCHFFVNAVSHNFQSYQPILLILNSKQWVDFY